MRKVFDPLVKVSDDLFTLLLCTNNLNGTAGGTLATYTRLNAGWFLGRSSITGAGGSHLDSWADLLSRYQEVIDVFLTAYGTAAPDVYGAAPTAERYREAHQ